jgi:hypothetical protein
MNERKELTNGHEQRTSACSKAAGRVGRPVDADVLKQCIPGCESLEKLSDTEMTAKVKLGIGPVHATFTGKVTLSDLDPPNGDRLSGEGTGGIAGHARAARPCIFRTTAKAR